MTSIAVLGASGYTGREVARILLRHSDFDLGLATTTTRAGSRLDAIHPELTGLTECVLQPFDAAQAAQHDAVVSCLPHGQSAGAIAAIIDANPEIRVVDLSADYRFAQSSQFESLYGAIHPDPDGCARSIYGLPEWNRADLRDAQLVANPGCYPTGAMLALQPLAAAGVVADAYVDGKSGISGAGAKPSSKTHFAHANESVSAYSVQSHRHGPEISTQLGQDVMFVPHLIPMDRGILSTCYVRLRHPMTADEVDQRFRAAYQDEPFIRIRDASAPPNTKHVAGTNFADISWHLAADGRHVVAITAIDNLIKGAAGQAIQNLNIILGKNETAGLLPAVRVGREVLA